MNDPVTGRDAIGGETTTPAAFITWWCALEQVDGGEVYRRNVLDAQATYTATGRWVPGVTRAMYVTLNGRSFDILNVINVDERGRDMVLELKERNLA